MTHGYAIDTSILVRLVTGHPPEVAESLYSELEKRHRNGNRFFADSMVIAEAYVAIQHHYAIRKAEVRTSLTDLLEKGIVAPLDGPPVLAALRSTTGAGLVDRLIVLRGQTRNLVTLTLDQKMAKLDGCEQIVLQM